MMVMIVSRHLFSSYRKVMPFGALWLFAWPCFPQEKSSAMEAGAVFGTTVVKPFGLRGDIYFIPKTTRRLPDFTTLKAEGAIYTHSLNVPPRNFREGFPGITKRYTWFAIDYHGRFYIGEPGRYGFELSADDGANLYIDDHLTIDNDGVHDPRSRGATLDLSGGIHSIRVSYFQGPCARERPYCLALQLFVTPPAGQRKIFSTEDYKPPSDPKDWKFGDPNDLKDPPDSDLKRRKSPGLTKK
jgi:hypothetical protein